jgi:NAD(P)-dependent dehydrogenase (short-subunit alcohol dehydrogenase family)
MGKNSRLADRVALVTGGSNGIGRATVELFAAEGATVAFIDIDAARGSSLQEQLTKAGHTALFLEGDVSQPESVSDCVDRVRQQFDCIDILFNHAGVISAKPFLDYSIEEWDWMMANNAKSVFLVTRAVLPIMLEKGRGVIVNTSSSAVKAVTKFESVYSASKAAMHQFCRAIAVEYRDAGIRCNLICPSFVRTHHAETELDQLRANGIFASQADVDLMQGRICEPEEVAATALFLASEDSSFINGAEIFVDNTFTAV